MQTNQNTLPETDCGNPGQFAGWMSIQQVLSLLTAVQVYSGANNNQGLADVAGENFGQRAEVMLNSYLTSTSFVETVSKFRTPLDEYMS